MYVLLDRRCPLAPQLHRQQSICKREGVPFRSKIELMIECIRTFEPVEGTLTHVLLDSWYSAKAIWRAARERGFLITTGLKSNRSIHVDDPAAPQGWRWQKLAEYTAGLAATAYTLVLRSLSGDIIEGGMVLSRERRVRDAEDSESTSSTR